MWKYAALISYVGAAYCGWQRQKGTAADGGPSIQATLEEALRKMLNQPTLTVVGSGRTDSGVHAAGQVAHFLSRAKEWDPLTLQKGLNSLLPPDIRVLGVQSVPIEFHAQHSAVKKQYSYYFQQGPAPLPFLMPYSWWIRKTLDQDAIRDALSQLKGEHDFKAFQGAGAKPGPTVRTVLEAEVGWEPISFPGMTPAHSGRPGTAGDTGLVRVRIQGTGFLKQMVRGISGTLLQIGEGRRPASDMTRIIQAQDRGLVGPTAPARALWLEQVWYPGLRWE